MVVANHRNAQLIINQKHLYHNIKMATERLNAGTELFMVVKADGYGHGAVQVAQVAIKAGASGFCVAVLDEALELRAAGIVDYPILVLGLTDPADAAVAAENNISLTVSSAQWLTQVAVMFNDLAEIKPLSVHFGLDTGMGRIGFQNKMELTQALTTLQANANYFNFDGIFTHFSTADSADDAYFQYQLTNFKNLTTVVNPQPKYVHVANSATSLWHDYTGSNMVRYGISGYGYNPSGREIEQLPYSLEPAMSLETQISYCKQVTAGKSIGYGATYTTTQPEWIGTVPIGYADGIPRNLQGFYVLIDGQKCEIVGRVCMDQFMIKLPHELPVGTKVTVMGQSGDKMISADDIAEYTGTISYEILCGFSQRLPRKYI